MRVLIQRVKEAAVSVDGEVVSKIGPGMLLLVGMMKGDEASLLEKMAAKVVGMRIFTDEKGHMNLDLKQINGEILSVSQFTLGADLRRGRRPGFDPAMPPEEAKALYGKFLEELRAQGAPVQDGIFGADMQVSLINDGPVTLWLDSDDLSRPRRQ